MTQLGCCCAGVTVHKSAPALRPARRFAKMIEAVCDRDREYLEQHPDRVAYARGYVPGELWPAVSPQWTAILVERLLPGRVDARRRVPVTEHSLEQLRVVMADPRVVLFVPLLDGKSLVPPGQVLA